MLKVYPTMIPHIHNLQPQAHVNGEQMVEQSGTPRPGCVEIRWYFVADKPAQHLSTKGDRSRYLAVEPVTVVKSLSRDELGSL